MKKILAIIALAFAGTAFAGNTGITMEYEYERGEGPDKGTNGSSVSLAPYYKFGDGWKADVKFESGRDFGDIDGVNNPIDSKIEARIRKDYKVATNLKLGLRLGIGEKFTDHDFTYYTIEPIMTYNLTDAWSVNTSYRYRNAFNTSNNFSTDTYKIGTAYKITPDNEVGVKYLQKYGDARTQGIELVYTHGF